MKFIGAEPPTIDPDQDRRRRRIRYALTGRTRLYAKAVAFCRHHNITNPTLLEIAGYTVHQMAEWLVNAEDQQAGRQ